MSVTMVGKRTHMTPAPDNRRSMALAVQHDFMALLQAVNDAPQDRTQAADLASIRAVIERGVRLSSELLGSLDGDDSD